MKFTPEMIEKAHAAHSASELMHMAHESGMEMTDAEAKGYFDMLHPAAGEMSDDELDNVSGGGCGGSSKPASRFNVGDRVTWNPPRGTRSCLTVVEKEYSDGVWYYKVEYLQARVYETAAENRLERY